jgi:SIR2-like domain
VSPTIGSLANQIRAAKASQDKFVLMIGAGASLKSGIKPTTQIMTELLAQYGGGIEGLDLRHRFDRLWIQLSEKQKDQYLMPYLTAAPSPGYEPLAAAIRRGYIDTVITFNFDRLLQKALVAAGLHEDEDFKVIVRGEHSDEKVLTLMEMSQPRIKILKLHGSLTGATFLWSEREMLNYPPIIEDLVERLTARPIIVCGYGFQDVCVVRAFSANAESGPIYCVNPGGIPSYLRGFMIARRSENLVIDGPDGEFDRFFTQIEEALASGPPAAVAPQKNPFKYLESHDVADAAWFLGRDEEANELTRKVQEQTKPVICVIGAAKSGKTSLVRAGMMARLDEERDLPIYLRCRGSLEQTISTQLQKFLPNDQPAPADLSIIRTLAATTNQHVVLILDQFERVLMRQPKVGAGREGLRCLRQLAETSWPNLTVVCVSTHEEGLALALLHNATQITSQIEFMTVSEMEPAQVSEMIQGLASRAGLELAPRIVEEIQDEYARGLESDQRFSLAHVQTICHMLCEQGPGDQELYRRLIRDERPTLELAINRCDIINFIEDVPNVEERSLLRDLIRLISHPECNQKIVTYVRDHVSEKWPAAVSARSGQH